MCFFCGFSFKQMHEREVIFLHFILQTGQVSDFSSCTGMCLLSPQLSLNFFPQMLHWMPPPLYLNLLWLFRVHKVRYAWPQWGHRGSLGAVWTFLYVVSNNGGIQKLSGTYHIQMIDFCAYLCALCLNVFEQNWQKKKIFIRISFFSVNIHLQSKVRYFN